MTDQIQPLDVNVNHLLTMVRNQLDNFGALVEKQANNIAESLDQERDDFNAMVDSLEKSYEEKVNLELKVATLEKQVADTEIENTQTVSKLRSELTQLKLKLETWNALKKERDELKAMDPYSLKKRLQAQKETSADRLTGMQKAKRECGEYRRENAKLSSRVATLEEAALMATGEVERLQNQIARQDGDVLNKVFEGKEGLECFIYLYHWGLSFKPHDGAISVINDAEFHIVMRTNRGINLAVSCSDYFVPFMPTCRDLEGYLPGDIYDAMTALFIEQLGKTHQYLIERMDWAKDTLLTDCGVLTEKQLNLLSAADFYSVYSIVHLPDETLASRVKGLSVKSAGDIRKTIKEQIVLPWCKENWTKEQVNKYGM